MEVKVLSDSSEIVEGVLFRTTVVEIRERIKFPKTFPITDDVTFTIREKQVLKLLHLSNKEIGVQLNISERTVKFWVKSLFDKMGCTKRAELLQRSVLLNFVEGD